MFQNYFQNFLQKPKMNDDSDCDTTDKIEDQKHISTWQCPLCPMIYKRRFHFDKHIQASHNLQPEEGIDKINFFISQKMKVYRYLLLLQLATPGTFLCSKMNLNKSSWRLTGRRRRPGGEIQTRVLPSLIGTRRRSAPSSPVTSAARSSNVTVIM